jgi:hypothetical protein
MDVIGGRCFGKKTFANRELKGFRDGRAPRERLSLRAVAVRAKPEGVSAKPDSCASKTGMLFGSMFTALRMHFGPPKTAAAAAEARARQGREIQAAAHVAAQLGQIPPALAKSEKSTVLLPNAARQDHDPAQ